MPRVLTWVILLVCVCAVFKPAWASSDPYRTLERAFAVMADGDAAGARAMIDAIDLHALPTALRFSALATTDLNAGHYANAETGFSRALRHDPQHLPALWGMSLCLLRQGYAFEAAKYVDRTVLVAPRDARVQALQAYTQMILGRTADAGLAAKAALDAGDTSPFLLATLAQLHRRMGYAARALEFGSFAARSYYGMDFLARPTRISLPLTLTIADNPRALTDNADGYARSRYAQRTAMEFSLPLPAGDDRPAKSFAIVAPANGETLRGTQLVHAISHDAADIRFAALQIDGVLRGMVNEVPFHFSWDADAVTPGEHTLRVRAYDGRGTVVAEDTITVTTVGDAPIVSPTPDALQTALYDRMLELTVPEPAPLSLFSHLGWWHRDLGETSQAIAAFEKAAAIDPSDTQILESLSALYRKQGLHPIAPSGEVRRGPATGKKLVALTFDDGPNPLYTPSILTELARHRASATFFVVGKMVQQYPQLTLNILADGHELANHTYTHPNLTRLTQQEIIAEVLRSRAIIKEVTGRQTHLFRPPGGNIDDFVTRQLRELDYNIVYWDINAGEYVKNPPEEQARLILSQVKDGSILLLHNGPVDGTLTILPTLLTELKQRGFTCVTVSELLKKP